MGSLDPRPYELSLDSLVVEAEAIAAVCPDGEPEIDELVIGDAPQPDRPTPPQVRYRAAWEPHRVLAWLKAPRAPEARIWIAAASNEASARDAADEAHGLLGHVHHVVPVPVLVGLPHEQLRGPAGERLVFLRRAPGAAERWQALHGGLSLAREAQALVEARLPVPTPAPRRPWWRFWA